MSIKNAGYTGVDGGQTCLGSFSLVSIKVMRSIIHSSICHTAVTLTLQLPGENLTDTSTSVVKTETAREMKQQETTQSFIPTLPYSLCVVCGFL